MTNGRILQYFRYGICGKIKFPEHKLSNQDNRTLFQLDIAMSFLLPQIERRRLMNSLFWTPQDQECNKSHQLHLSLLPRERDVPNVHRKQTRRHPWLVANAISPSAKTTLHIIVLHVLVDNRNSLTS